MPLPHVVNPAVHADGHEHVEVDPQREPVFRFLVTQPVNDFWFVQFGFQAVPQVPRNLKGGHKHANVCKFGIFFTANPWSCYGILNICVYAKAVV